MGGIYLAAEYQGSVWRKWDLHLHTPATKLASQFEGSSPDEKWDNYVAKLDGSDIEVIGVTNYFCIEGYQKLLDLRHAGRLKNIKLILPNIEFRLSAINHKDVFINLHLIFSNEIMSTRIETFLNRLPLFNTTDSKGNLYCNMNDLRTVGFDKAMVDHKKLEEMLEADFELHKDYLVVGVCHGYGSIRPAPGDGRDKKLADEIDKFSHFFFGRDDNRRFYLNAERFTGAIPKPVVHASDAHKLDDIGSKYTWIKADPTFEGLRQILIEPEHRVYIGDTPPVIQRVEKNKTKYIESVRIDKETASSHAEESWFRDIHIDINHELVAIIGNKGSGKSALADIIGLVGNSKNHDHFSFLNVNKFRRPRENKASHFVGTIQWVSGLSDKRILSENPKDYDFEKVKYFPQKYLEVLCNDEKDKFEEELENVIFSHVPEEDRLGKSSLKELIAYRAEAIEERIIALREKLGDLNDEIIRLEDLLDPAHKKILEEQVKVKEAELRIHESAKPVAVKVPGGDEATEYKSKEIAAKIKELTEQRRAIVTKENNKILLRKKEAITDRLLNKIERFRGYYDDLIADITDDSVSISLDPKELVTISIDTSKLVKIKSDITSELYSITKELDPQIEDSLQWKHAELEKNIRELSEQLDEPNRRYQAYLRQTAEWEGKKKELIGDSETLDSIEYIKSQLKYIDENARRELEGQRAKRIDLSRLIFQEKKKLIDIYRQLYVPVDKLLTVIENAGNPVRFDATIEIKGFVEQFLGHINQRVKGSFMGTDEGALMLRHIMDKTDSDDEESVVTFLKEIISCLEHDHRIKEERLIRSQIKTSREAFYGYIFSLDYLVPRFTLKLGHIELPQLSPGERGALLLIFYLMIDKNDIPLIIDQPEENLDNQSVYQLLVHYIKEAKKRRQIIIVTHNPNLAVVCDAEQIIYAKIDKSNKNAVSYESGSIENPTIKKYIIDVLEGTAPAFIKREDKYSIKR